MKKEFVPYELALKMKQLGFDEPCFGYYVDGELRGVNLGIEQLGGIKPYYQRFGFHALSNHDIDKPTKIVVTAPTYSQAFRWFREKGYRYTISSDLYEKNGRFYFDTWTDGLIVSMFESGFKYTTYEEAELACLTKLIEIVELKSE